MKPDFRIVTYNIHKCRGIDGRMKPKRIAEVLAAIDADIIALQEVVNIEGKLTEDEQTHYLASHLGDYGYCVGENRRHKGGAYGNVILSRLPIVAHKNCDITCRSREPRGCLRADIKVASGAMVHVFNVHMGTSFFERREQAPLLLSDKILNDPSLRGPRILVGDFNEWTRGVTTRMLSKTFKVVDLAEHVQRKRTYPGFLPLMHLDNIYYDASLELARFQVTRTSTSLVASDHLPLVADFKLQAKVQENAS
jgi:endonuclease/exonuclease/phosphatase family metal-dependent hydrolase